ncbi:MAG: A/G-specific adenine glycosylase [Armatimonadota bacterium]
MTKVEVSAISQSLTDWFAKSARALPWRDDPTPYRVWLSEIMLQQTTVSACKAFFERFVKALPDIQALASASEGDVLALWEGLGYYTRARNLHKSAIIIAASGGELPDEPAELIKLPGIGDYTAGAIAAIAFNKPAAMVDANIRRVLGRVLAIDPGAPEAEATIRDVSRGLSESGIPRVINQAIMEVGALVCKPRVPDCMNCPLRGQCKACNGQQFGYFGSQSQRTLKTYVDEVCVLVKAGDGWLVSQSSDGRWKGMWEFPRSKVEESPVETSRALLKQRFGIEPSHLWECGLLKHVVTRYSITLHVVRCELSQPTVLRAGELQLVLPEQLHLLAMPSPMRRIANAYIRDNERFGL